MKKLTIMLLSTCLTAGVFIGCSDNKEENTLKDISKINELEFCVPRGITSIGLSTMIEQDVDISTQTGITKIYDLKYNLLDATDALMTSVMKGEVDIAVVPSNVALKAYNKDTSYKLLGTLGFGSLYLVSTDGDISFDELKGKEIYNVGKGLTPDIVFKTLLDKNGIAQDDVTLNYVGGATELAPTVLSGKAKYAIVPEPALSTIISKNPDIKIIANLNDMWKESFGSNHGFPQSSIIIKSSLIEEDAEFVQKLIDLIDSNVDKVNSDVIGAATAEIKNGSKIEEDIIRNSIERANLDFVEISENKEDYNSYYSVLKELDPESIGANLPDENFFYEK